MKNNITAVLSLLKLQDVQMLPCSTAGDAHLSSNMKRKPQECFNFSERLTELLEQVKPRLSYLDNQTELPSF